METQPEPEVFRLTDPWCSCGKPWGLPCFGAAPPDYYTNVDFATAAWARSQYCDHEVHHDRNDNVEPKAEVRGGRWILSFDDLGFPVQIEIQMSKDVETKPDTMCVLETMRDWPSDLTTEQLGLLEARNWDGFMTTVTNLGEHYDVILWMPNRIPTAVGARVRIMREATATRACVCTNNKCWSATFRKEEAVQFDDEAALQVPTPTHRIDQDHVKSVVVRMHDDTAVFYTAPEPKVEAEEETAEEPKAEEPKVEEAAPEPEAEKEPEPEPKPEPPAAAPSQKRKRSAAPPSGGTRKSPRLASQ